LTQRSNRTRWIVLGVVAASIVLGGGTAVLLAVRSHVERSHDTPSGVQPGTEFRHDSFLADEGWQLVEAQGDFDIVDLTLTNQTLRPRSAFLEFSIYRGDEVIGVVSCSIGPLGNRESGVMDCFSADEFVGDYDEVKVADTF
jgi:hypothetical protein